MQGYHLWVYFSLIFLSFSRLSGLLLGGGIGWLGGSDGGGAIGWFGGRNGGGR